MKKYYNYFAQTYCRLTQIFKELKYTIVFAVLAVLFIDTVTRIYLDHIGNPILSSFTSSIFADCLFIMAIIIIAIFFLSKLKKGYYVSGAQFLLSGIIISFYLYFRFILLGNLFRPLSCFSYIKYADVVLLYFSVPFFLKLFSLAKKQNNSLETTIGNSLSTVKAITSKNHDILGRASRAVRLSAEIKNYKASESLAIGIVGEWGSGKTSFVNMVKESIAENNDSNILIDFNPWLNISVGSIIEDYFKTLEKAVEDYSMDIARSIKQYCHSVLGIHKNAFTDALLKGSDLILDVSLTERFTRLNTLLNKLNRRVYVFIDDFDRLQSDEIFETLKLIRNTAGFDSFTYIVAYDREYLIESLKKHGIPKPEAFSEKIFQFEIEMLPATSEQIHGYIIKGLKEAFPEKDNEVKDFFEVRYGRFAPLEAIKNVTAPLRNIRDVERFMNTFVPDYKQVVEEVYFRDYFLLKLIKFKYNTVYTLLFSHWSDFLSLEDFQSAQGKTPRYKIVRSDGKEHGKHYYDIFGGSKLETYLVENTTYGKPQLSEIATLINNLFFQESSKDTLSIVYETNYTKYFRDELSKGNLSLIEFRDAMKRNYSDVSSAIERWYLEGKGENIYFFLLEQKIWELQNRETYENYIKAMFHLGSIPKQNLSGRPGVFGFDFAKLSWNIDDSRGEIAKLYYGNDSTELIVFVEQLFANAAYPYLFESSFCHYLERYGYGNTSTTFTKEKHQFYQAEYFRLYCDSISEIDSMFWYLYHNCQVAKYDVKGTGTYVTYILMDEAKEIFKEFTLNHLDNVLLHSISHDTDFGYNDKGLTGLSKQVNVIFGGISGLKAFLMSESVTEEIAESSLFLDEFISYLSELEKENKMIIFPFTYPPAAALVENKKSMNRN